MRRLLVLTLGHEKVGKSTILEALRTEVPWWSSSVAFSTTVAQLDRTTEVGFVSHHLRGFEWAFRDFPGQTEYYATNVRFLTADIAVLLMVIDITSDQRETQLLQWYIWLRVKLTVSFRAALIRRMTGAGATLSRVVCL